MGTQHTKINTRIKKFIKAQKLFFVATATENGRINLSPKGMDAFRVIDENKVLWLNVTGSGNETAAHLLQNNRMTIMFCAFEGAPNILRLFGQAKVHHVADKKYSDFSKHFPKSPGARQIIEIQVDLVQTSCGMGVPYYDYKGERKQLEQWAIE